MSNVKCQKIICVKNVEPQSGPAILQTGLNVTIESLTGKGKASIKIKYLSFVLFVQDDLNLDQYLCSVPHFKQVEIVIFAALPNTLVVSL